MCKRVDICKLIFLGAFLNKYGYSGMTGCLVRDLNFGTFYISTCREKL